jgi:hypothetical protein
MYGKIFSSMFKGSLYGSWEAIVTFTVMIVLADKEGEVDMTPQALAASTSIPLDIIQRGIALLEAPDTQSRTPDEDGRRIVRVSDSRDWGWRITNYAHYRAIRTAEERREYFKQHKRKKRAAKRKSPPVSTTSPQSPPIAVGSIAEADAKVFTTLWESYPKRAGSNSKHAARKAWDARRNAGVSADEMLAGVLRYAAFIRATQKEGTEYVKQVATFLGTNEHWLEPWTCPATKQNKNMAVLSNWLKGEPNGKS